MSKLDLRGAIKEPKQREALEQALEQFVGTALQGAVTPPTPFEIGKNYLVRTVTMVDVGRVTRVIGNFIVMENASWIADTGRFYECLERTGVFNEVEPFKHPIYLNVNAIIDATPWPYDLPSEPK